MTLTTRLTAAVPSLTPEQAQEVEILYFVDAQAYSPWFYAKSRSGKCYRWGWCLRSGMHWADCDGKHIQLIEGERGDAACHRHLNTAALTGEV